MDKFEIISKLKKNKEILEKQFSVSRIGLFGSFAAGKQGATSDIDLIYELKPGNNEGLQELYNFEEFIKKILQAKDVDLVNAKYVNPIVEEEISNKIIYV